MGGTYLGMNETLGRNALMAMTCSVVSPLDGLGHTTRIRQTVQLYRCLRPSYELLDYHHPKNSEDYLTICIVISVLLVVSY